MSSRQGASLHGRDALRGSFPDPSTLIEHDSEETLIRHSSRVVALGEVFTPTWLVREMLDLVPEGAVERFAAKCLDPACGHGQFLLEALRRKLKTVIRAQPNRSEYQYNSLTALASIYGVDIDLDNVRDARERLSRLTVSAYRSRYMSVPKTYERAVDFVLERNIILADFLQDDFTITEFKPTKGVGYFALTTAPFRNIVASSEPRNDDLFAEETTVEGPRHWRFFGRCSGR